MLIDLGVVPFIKSVILKLHNSGDDAAIGRGILTTVYLFI